MTERSAEAMLSRIEKLFTYHGEEWAARLAEIGGPGVGGAELKYSLFRGVYELTPEIETQHLLTYPYFIYME